MQSLAQGIYTADQVDAELHSDSRTVDFRFTLLDADLSVIGDLTSVTGGSVEHGALRDIPRTAKFTLSGSEGRDIDYLRDLVQPWWRMQMPDGGWVEWPQGVFLLNTPTRQTRSGGASRDIEGYDLTQALADDLVADRVTGSSSIAAFALLQILETLPDISLSIEPDGHTFPVVYEWAPGTPRLRIINDALQLINYTGVKFNGYGQAVMRPYQSPGSRSPSYTYADDSKSITLPELSDTIDLYGLPNRWIGLVSEPDRDPLISVYTNSNAGSPTSTTSRGRVIARLLDNVGSVDQPTLDGLVLQAAESDSQVYRQVTFSTATMPHHEDLDLLGLALNGLVVTGSFTETGWSMPFEVGGQMTHTIRQLVTV